MASYIKILCKKRYCEFWFNFVTLCLQLLFLSCVLEEQEPSDRWYMQIVFPWIHEPWINAQAHRGTVWGAAHGEEISHRSEAYSTLQTNYVFCINVSVAQSRDKNCNEGEGRRLNPPKVPRSWRIARPGSSQPYWCRHKALSTLPFPQGLFPHTSAGFLFPCHPPRWAHVPRAPIPPSVPPFAGASRSTLHL